MKKKYLLIPALSGLLLSSAVLTSHVAAEEPVQAQPVLEQPPADSELTPTDQPAEVSELMTEETPASDEVVTILHTNDIHGRIEEGKGVIGVAKLATVVEDERAKGTTLVLDAGDAFQGLPISNSTKGEDMATLMNTIGYDAMAVGNHEFDFSLDQAKKYKELLNFPILSSNTYIDNVRVFEPATIIDKNKDVVGDEFVVIGVTTPETSTKTHPNNVNGVVFKDPITEVNNVIAEIEARSKAEGKTYNRYVILAHLGIDATTPEEWRGSTLAKSLANNDLLVGKTVIVIDGHSHTQHDEVFAGKTMVTYNQTGSYLNNIGKITLNSTKVLSAGVITAKDASVVAPHKAVAKVVAEIKAKYDAENAVVVLDNMPVELNGDRSNVRVRETNLGNVVADAMLDYGKAGFSHKTNLAVTNGGGLRATIAKDKPVTKGDIIAVLPFGNIISQIEVTGQQIKDMFDKSLSAGAQKDEAGKLVLDDNGQPLLEANGGFLHIAGAMVHYDSNLEAGKRVLSIKVLDPETGHYLPLDVAKTYYLATNDFLAAGGDGYTMLGGAREEGPSLDAVFADYLKQIGTAGLKDHAVVNPNTRLINQVDMPETEPEVVTETVVETEVTNGLKLTHTYQVTKTKAGELVTKTLISSSAVPVLTPVVHQVDGKLPQRPQVTPSPQSQSETTKETKPSQENTEKVAVSYTSNQATLPKTNSKSSVFALVSGMLFVVYGAYGLRKRPYGR